jgi:hypothetical protein
VSQHRSLPYAEESLAGQRPGASPRSGALPDAGETLLRACRALLAVAGIVAVVYQAVHPGALSTTDYFSYFTVLSNVFAAAVFFLGAVRPAHARTRTTEMLRGAAVVYILTTGIVYAVLLSGHPVAYPWANDIVHRIVPVAMALDWLLDPPRHELSFSRTAAWICFPLVYVAYTLVRGAIVNWYPYFFVDPHRHGGYLLVAGDCVAVGAGILGLAFAVTWVGRRRSG